MENLDPRSAPSFQPSDPQSADRELFQESEQEGEGEGEGEDDFKSLYSVPHTHSDRSQASGKYVRSLSVTSYH